MTNFTPPAQPDGNLTTSRPRITWLDSLKGFTIISVIVGHIVGGYKSSGLYASYEDVEIILARLVYSFHMPLFFLISGFFFSRAYIELDGKVKVDKLKVQLLDLIAVYVVFSVILVCFYALLGSHANHSISFSDLLCIGWKPVSIYWYIHVLILLYLANVLFVKVKQKVLLVALFLIVGIFSAVIPSSSYTVSVNKFLFFLPFFYIGTVVHQKHISPNWGMAILGALVAVLLYNIQSPEHAVVTYNVEKIIIALGLCVFFWKAFSSMNWLDNKVLEICGRYCLEIYVIHSFLTAGFRSAFVALGVTNFWLSLALNTILSTALPIIFAMALERIGLHDLLFRPVRYMRSLMASKKPS